MSSSVIGQFGITLYDINMQTLDKSVKGLIKKHLPKRYYKIERGNVYSRNGRSFQRIYINLYQSDAVDAFIKQRPVCLNGQPIRVTRTLPNTCVLYDRSVTGLKIRIHSTENDHSSIEKLNENDLKKYFKNYGKIRRCHWLNEDQTEALFQFEDPDAVDQSIFYNSSLQLKGKKIDLEKTATAQDCVTYERPYVVHVTNLPLCVTSEELSKIFEVPIAIILLYPCYRIEESCVAGGRSTSEAWIKNIPDEKNARTLAKTNSGRLLRANKIKCEVILESIDEQELCESFQKAQCLYTGTTCHYKHFSCSEPDTCDDKECWYGHSEKRQTISRSRFQYRSEDAQYRVRFGNLPANVTHEDLLRRLKINAKYSHLLILDPREHSSNSSKLAYLIRQPLENRLRHQIDKWHNISFSATMPQKIECQLEVNQDYFEWNDSMDLPRSVNSSRCPSPVRSIQSAHSNRTNPRLSYSSAASGASRRPSATIAKQSYVQRQTPTNQPRSPKQTPQINSLRSRSVAKSRRAPSDLSDRWHWMNQMIPKNPIDHDEMYWVESTSNNVTNVVIKIYLPKNDRGTSLRAQREQIALKHLANLTCVPKLLDDNVNVPSKLTDGEASNKEFWTLMTLIDGERLSDYIKNYKFNLKEIFQISRQLLGIVKDIHARNIIHRDIQPTNILVGQQAKSNGRHLILMNFASAWIDGDQWTNSTESIDDLLGNRFYRMPQFEESPNHTIKQIPPARYSPTIDTTGICAILFWLITGHEPKESRDICGQVPHQLRDNSKIIETKLQEVTGSCADARIYEHMKRHLTLIFDRGFAHSDQQWTVDELDYQLQFMLELLLKNCDQANYFLVPQNKKHNIIPPSIPFEDPFVYIVSLIHHLKTHFVNRYSHRIHWSTEEENHWIYQDKRIENHDLLIYHSQEKNFSIDIQWHVNILKGSQFSIEVKVQDCNKIVIELPLGVWTINQQTHHFDTYLKSCEMEMKILLNILSK